MAEGEQPTGKRPRAWREGLLTAVSLGVALLLLSLLRLAGDSQSSLFHDSVLDSILSGHLSGSALARNVVLFVLAILALHVAYGAACLLPARLSYFAWPRTKSTLKQHLLLWFIATTAWLLLSNATHFPRSSLGSPYAEALNVRFAGQTPATWVGSALLIVLAAALAAAVRKWARHVKPATMRARSGAAVLAALCVTALCAIGVAVAITRELPAASPQDHPNVVLIGIDSLREDLVAPSTSAHLMPHLEAFLSGSVAFDNAITPLARTFPSWVSILTGRSPHSTGAIVNLLPRSLVHEGDTIATRLRRAGYSTTYAIDDVRFSNVDESYGFDQRVSPPIGASEFLIGFFADTPLSNLVMNTRLGELLFPHVYANRAIATTYDPESFLTRFARETRTNQPAFLAIHLTLPHWPYTWADAPASQGDQSTRTLPDFYLNAVRRVDSQFAGVIELLRSRGILRNALVFVLSDHGETFGVPADSLVPVDDPHIVSLSARPTWGHGSSVFTPDQYRVVLAARGFGSVHFNAAPGTLIDAPVSVEDIVPTIADLLNLPGGALVSGRSLAPLLQNRADATAAFTDRIRFTETEFNPAVVATAAGEISAHGIEQAITYYRIDPVSDHVEFKPAYLKSLLYSRQYAALGTHQLVAAVPVPGEGTFQYFLFSRSGGAIQALSGAPDAAAGAEATALWQALHQEFRDVLGAANPSAQLARNH